MLFFGHIGITLGIALVADKLGVLSSASKSPEVGDVKEPCFRALPDRLSPDPLAHNPQITKMEPHKSVIPSDNRKAIDYRFILLGALLPDLIDKPVGFTYFSNLRVFSHSLLFLLIIIAAGIFLYRFRKQLWLLCLAFGVFWHLILDQMWLNTHTLFWPLLGLPFERLDVSNWMYVILQELRNEPAVYLPEIIGLVILIYLGIMLVIKRGVFTFIREGRISLGQDEAA